MTRGADLWPLDDDEAPPSPPAREETLTVPQLSARIEGLFSREFPRPFWLVGEASGLTRARRGRNGHWYFTLVDDQAQGDRRPAVDVIVWRSTVSRLFGSRGRLAGVLDPEDGVVLRVKVQPNWYGPRGQVSWVISDIDPDFTLGSLDRERREVLARLQQEGAHTWNKALALPDVPLRIGVVTSVGSAAHHDVLETLSSSGLGFRVVVCDARTQGAETAATVRAALLTLGAMDLDVVLLVRGGGSRLDLSWFDKEPVARAVATCGLPVLTGIGHEIDSSVADAVAHRAFKTPTATAEFLVALAREARDDVERAARRVAEGAAASLLDARRRIDDLSRRLASAGREGLADARLALAGTGRRLASRATRQLTQGSERLAVASHRLASTAPLARLDARAAALDVTLERLAQRARVALDLRQQGLDAAEEKARLLDPRMVLKRGFAWLRREDGAILKDAAAVSPGERLTAVLRDGELPLRHAGDSP